MTKTESSIGVTEVFASCPCPRPGQGVHNWFYRVARRLHQYGLKPETIIQLLQANATRPPRANEVEDAVQNSLRDLHGPRSGAEPRTAPWPQADQGRIETIIAAGPCLSGLRGLSPWKRTDGKPHTEEIIDLLFPGDPLLCVGQTKYRFNTLPRGTWRGRLAARQFIVPSPMSRVSGITQSGKESKHSLDNTGPRRFLVIEFDQGTFDQHAALLWHLAEYMPLVMAVHSGSKSLHGWFFCAGQDEQELLRFMRYGVSLGADRATWVKSQFVRLPDGGRDNGRRQEVIYFNPSRIKSNG